MLGRTLHSIHNAHGKPYIMLEDGIRIEYDALMVATGVSEVVRNIPGNYFSIILYKTLLEYFINFHKISRKLI